MKTPIYETSPGALIALLFSRAFALVDLYTFTLITGEVLRYCTGSIDVAFGGNSWSSRTVRMDDDNNKAVGHWKVGLDIDTWTVPIYPRPRTEPLSPLNWDDGGVWDTGSLWDAASGDDFPDKIGDVPWLQAAVGGSLDGALCDVDRAYFGSWPPQPAVLVTGPTGVYNIFKGRVAEVDIGRSGAVVVLNSLLELLMTNMPRNLFQDFCSHTLFDVGCGLNAADFVQTGAVLAGSTQSIINTNLPTPGGSGTYNLGRLFMTSGKNAGFGRTVRTWDSGTGAVNLTSPFSFPITTGDTIRAYPGCDKTQAACALFNNSDNYGGEPFIPTPETAL